MAEPLKDITVLEMGTFISGPGAGMLLADLGARVIKIEQTGRIQAPGYRAPETYVLDHGYCRSVYISDPNGMILEFTADEPAASAADAKRRSTAHAELARWLAGDHSDNNMYRHEAGH